MMKLSLDDFFDLIKNEQTDYIVRLAYKHDFEKEYTISNEVLECCPSDDEYVWLNDWNEGETDVYVIGFIKVSDVDVQEYKGGL